MASECARADVAERRRIWIDERQPAMRREPHRLVFYLQETVAEFHGYYTRYKGTEKVIGPDARKTAARLFLCDCLRRAMANTLALLGVSAPERMDSRDAGESVESLDDA